MTLTDFAAKYPNMAEANYDGTNYEITGDRKATATAIELGDASAVVEIGEPLKGWRDYQVFATIYPFGRGDGNEQWRYCVMAG